MAFESLSQPVRARLRDLGITDPDPSIELHRNLADTISRLGNAPYDSYLIGLMWCFHSELTRAGRASAAAEAEHDRTLGAGVIRYRMRGEKSAEVAKMRAESEDTGVYLSKLEKLRTAQEVHLAREGLRILQADLDRWRTNEARRRQEDEWAARSGSHS